MVTFDGEYAGYQNIKDWSRNIYSLEKELAERPFVEGIKQSANYGWGFLSISLLGIIFIAIVIAFYRRRFSLLLDVLFNWKLSKQIIRYEKVHSHPVNILLMLTFLMFFSLFYALSISEMKEGLEFISLLKSIGLFVLIYFIGKLILYRFTAWLFEEGELINQYVFQLNLFSKFVGVFLLGLWILLIYSPISTSFLFNLSLIILLVFMGLQSYRGLIIGRSEGRNLLLIILYLCTLEILPWLLIFKSLKSNW